MSEIRKRVCDRCGLEVKYDALEGMFPTGWIRIHVKRIQVAPGEISGLRKSIDKNNLYLDFCHPACLGYYFKEMWENAQLDNQISKQCCCGDPRLTIGE